MQVLFLSSEVFPYSKTGGLADVVGALPQALVKLGHEVLVVSPWYQALNARPAPHWVGDVEVPFDGGFSRCGLGTLEQAGVRFVFIGHPYFQRERLYGFEDDVKRFALLVRAAPQAAAQIGFRPEVVHVHDWHAAYLPLVLKRGWHLPEGFAGLPSVFTVHNVQHQGHSDLGATLYWLRLPDALRTSYIDYFGAANAMQAGLGFADAVTTVSPSYAREIQSPEYGHGLDGTFSDISHKLSGILNGIDTEIWNPATDLQLPVTYDADDMSGKAMVKRLFCRRWSLEEERPLLGVVSRLAGQKGIDLLYLALPGLLDQGWNVALLGSGEEALERLMQRASSAVPERILAHIGYDESLAHQIYAASDAFAMPSRFEPCGLGQLIAMRYGSLPIVRATGGLKDTVRHDETGFLFEHASPEGLLWASGEALARYRDEARWQAMMARAMQQDFSWERSATRYAELYQHCTESRKAGQYV